MNFTISKGFADQHRSQIALLFWAAFSGKLGRIMGPEDKALQFIESVLNPNFALTALSPQGDVLGVAGFKTKDGALVGGTLNDMAEVYGWAGGLLRGVVLDQLERSISDKELLMDGIFVAASARGQGIGSALLQAIKCEARKQKADTIRLDVINTNPKARALYERQGFKPGATKSSGPFKWLFGFDHSTAMHFAVAE